MARFTKGNGLGNDYLVMEERDIDFPLGPAAVRWICHRNWGVGSDGILLRTASRAADVGLRIFNPEALMGNSFRLKPKGGGPFANADAVGTPHVTATLEPTG